MSITDELRKYVGDFYLFRYKDVRESLTAIADRIDAEHEAMLVDARKTVYQGYIELPKDADNVPWSVGDRDEDGNEVIALKLASDGWYVITDGEWPYRPERKRHYHAPTVEDVLSEMLNEAFPADFAHRSEAIEAMVAEYAKRLTLAEGEDE